MNREERDKVIARGSHDFLDKVTKETDERDR